MTMQLVEVKQELFKMKMNTARDIAELKFRFERVIREKDEKLEALCKSLGVTIEENVPEQNKYRVIERSDK